MAQVPDHIDATERQEAEARTREEGEQRAAAEEQAAEERRPGSKGGCRTRDCRDAGQQCRARGRACLLPVWAADGRVCP